MSQSDTTDRTDLTTDPTTPHTGQCPHCGRPFDEEATRTTVECGYCDETHELLGTKRALAGTAFECDACGHVNIVPSPEVGG